MSTFRGAYILVLLLVFFISCRTERKKDKDNEFVRVYAEILFLTEKYKNDSLKLRMKIDSVLTANKMTVQKFDSIANAYSKEPQRWVEFFEEVKKYLDERSLNVKSEKH